MSFASLIRNIALLSTLLVVPVLSYSADFKELWKEKGGTIIEPAKSSTNNPEVASPNEAGQNEKGKSAISHQPEQVKPAEPVEPVEKSIRVGTGVAVSPDGHIATAYHIIGNADKIEFKSQWGEWSKAKIWKKSVSTDIVILKTDMKTPNFLTFAESGEYKQGQRVFTIGFPVVRVLGFDPKYTEGSISSLTGIQGEDSLLQIAVPIQPGNSGGPLLIENGKVVGLITSTVAIVNFFRITGTLPQNINWAVKSTYIKALTDKSYQRSDKTDDIIEYTKKCIFLIRATD